MHTWKGSQESFPCHFTRASAVGSIVQSDVVGPLEVSFQDHYRYVSFLEDHSRYLFIGLLEHRSDLQVVVEAVSDKIRQFGGAGVTFNFSRSIQQLHSDGAMYYIGLRNTRGGDSQNVAKRVAALFFCTIYSVTQRYRRESQPHHGQSC